MNVDRFNNREYSVALYIRLSREDGDKEESESVTNQRKILKAYLKDNTNFKFYAEYVDDGYTGTNFNRPGFQKMLKDIENKKVDMVITKSLSRLGRDYIETGRYIESYFPEHEVRYISILDDVDTELDKNCDTAAFKNIMNDFYAKETSRNIKKTKNRKKKEGFYYTSVAPFGYEKIDKAGHLKINNAQAEVIRRIFRLFLDGKGTYQISCLLNEEKVLPPGLQMNMKRATEYRTNTTDKWTHTQVKRVLTNPIYIGNCVQNKTRKISYKSKKMIRLPEEEYTITENHHEAIIDNDTFNTVQKMFERKGTQKISKDDPLLKTLLYCTHCHNRMTIVKKQEKYKDKVWVRRYVRCATAERKISNRICFKQYINYEKLEPLILEEISKTIKKYFDSGAFNSESALKKLIDQSTNREKIEEKALQVEKQLENVNKKLNMLYADRLNGIIEEQDYILFSEAIKGERQQIEKVKEEIAQELYAFENDSRNEEMKEEMKRVLQDVVLNQVYTKEILQHIINKIEIDKDKQVLIHFNFYELNCLGGFIDVKEAIS